MPQKESSIFFIDRNKIKTMAKDIARLQEHQAVTKREEIAGFEPFPEAKERVFEPGPPPVAPSPPPIPEAVPAEPAEAELEAEGLKEETLEAIEEPEAKPAAPEEGEPLASLDASLADESRRASRSGRPIGREPEAGEEEEAEKEEAGRIEERWKKEQEREKRGKEKELKRQREEGRRLAKEKSELGGVLEEISQKRQPLEMEKAQLLKEINRLEEALKPILEKETGIERRKEEIDERTEAALSPEEKKEIEKLRWAVGEERHTVEKEKWEMEDKIENVEAKIQGLEAKGAEVAEKEKEIKEKIKRISERENEMRLEDEREKIEGQLAEVLRKKEEKQMEIINLSQKKEEAERVLAFILKDKEDLDREIKIIEKEEVLTKSLNEKQKIEKKRWEIEGERREIEEKYWAQENEKNKAELPLKRAHSEYHRIVRKEEELEEELNKIIMLLPRTGLHGRSIPRKIETREPYREEKEGSAQGGEPEPAEENLAEEEVDLGLRPTERPSADEVGQQEISEPEADLVGRSLAEGEAKAEEEREIELGRESEMPEISEPSRVEETETEEPVPSSEQVQRIIVPGPLSLKEKILARLTIAIALALIFINLFLFWYWYVKIKKGELNLFPSIFKQGFLVSQEEPAEGEESLPTGRQALPLIPPAHFSIEKTEPLEIEDLQALPTGQEGLLELLLPIGEKDLEENTFTRIVIKDLKENRFLGLGAFLGSLGVEAPEEFYTFLNDDFTLFVYSQKEGNRFGFVTGTKEEERVKDLLNTWEPTMEEDFAPFFSLMNVEGAAISPVFKNGFFRDTTIRYQTFSKNDLGICYTFFNNYFIFTSSWTSMEKTIEALLL